MQQSRPPSRDRFLGEPDREASPLAQGRIVLGPVLDPVPLLGIAVTASGIGLEGHARCPTGGARSSYVAWLRLPTRIFAQQPVAARKELTAKPQKVFAARPKMEYRSIIDRHTSLSKIKALEEDHE
jgi:hypothetical protein